MRTLLASLSLFAAVGFVSEIKAVEATTLECLNPDSVISGHHHNHCCPPRGRRGATGPTGPTGATGATGALSSLSGAVTNIAVQTIDQGTTPQTITLETQVTNFGIPIGINSLVIPVAGTYVASFTLQGSFQDGGPTGADTVGVATFGVFVNGNFQTGFTNPINGNNTTAESQFSITGFAIFHANAGDPVQILCPTFTSTDEEATLNIIHVYLSVFQIQ